MKTRLGVTLGHGHGVRQSLKLVILMDKIPTHQRFYIDQQANVGLYL